MCTEGFYEPIVFLKKPYSLRGQVVFGDSDEGQKGCPKNKTKITFNTIANVLENAAAVYSSTKKLGNEDTCPRQILKFNPPALSENCRRDAFPYLTTIYEYGLNTSFQNVSFNYLEYFFK